jgi:hypothetical protein
MSTSVDNSQSAAEVLVGNDTAKPTVEQRDQASQPHSNGTNGRHETNGKPHWEAPTKTSSHQRAKTEFKEKVSGKKDKIANTKQKIKDKTNPAGGFDTTPLPDAPPGYTVRFTFHKASNLPVADVHTQAADPYIHATLTTDAPKRHKEDPLLTYRTRTIRRTTEPEWEEAWIVANIPRSGFTLKCRLYDEDYPDHDDRLGNVTIRVPWVDEKWKGFGPDGKQLKVKKRAGSKRAYLLKAATTALSKNATMDPHLHISIDVLGKSDPPHAQVYTVGPTHWVKHFSPMIGRLMGIKVNKDENHDASPTEEKDGNGKTKKYE